MKEQIKQHKPTEEELQTFGKEIFAVLSECTNNYRLLVYLWNKLYNDYIGPAKDSIGGAWYGKYDFDKCKIIYIDAPENIETISPADILIADATSYLVLKMFENTIPALYEIFKIPGNFEKYTDELCEQYRKDNDNGN